MSCLLDYRATRLRVPRFCPPKIEPISRFNNEPTKFKDRLLTILIVDKWQTLREKS